ILRRFGSAMSGTCSFGSNCGGGFIAATRAVAEAAVTIGEAPVIVGTTPISSGQTPFITRSEDEGGGGACGSVDMSGGPGDFGGGMMLGLFLIAMVGYLPKLRSA